MDLNLQAAIADARIGGQAGIVRIANTRRPASDYLLATLLPERNLPTYEANASALTVRTTMAGAVGMDSKYPEGGLLDFSTFREKVAKIAIQHNLPEEMLRQLQALADGIVARGGSTTDLAVNTVLNFLDKLILQPIDDRKEWLRAQCLFVGAIAWNFNGVTVTADYGIPTANIFTTRTSTDAYDSSASKFWTDAKLARQILGASFNLAIASRATIEAIIYNSVNAINVLSVAGGRYNIQMYRGTLERPSTDARETMTLIEYDAEGEVMDLSNPGQTTKVKFVPDGVVGFFGKSDRSRQFIPGEGATEDGDQSLELGYTHIGPTTEGGGAPGAWSRIYTPEDMPMQLRGQGVANVLPVLRSPAKVVIASTDLS